MTIVLTNVSSTIAWGTLGHETVAYLATHYLTPQAATYCHALLADSSDEYLAGVATWADSYRYTRAGQFSEPLHFIDAKDHPPEECTVDFERDCKAAGCVVTAIQNYTMRLLDPLLVEGERNIALKFIIHFIGDIHQPLHNEDLQRGGNGITVRYNSTTTNLHSVWDTFIPDAIGSTIAKSTAGTKVSSSATLEIAHRWAEALAHEIEDGRFTAEAPSWVRGLEVSKGKEAAMIWSSEANGFVCSVVMPAGIAGVEGQDLAGIYTVAAKPTVELLVARAGYRLGNWLNLVVDRLIMGNDGGKSEGNYDEGGDFEGRKIGNGASEQSILSEL